MTPKIDGDIIKGTVSVDGRFMYGETTMVWHLFKVAPGKKNLSSLREPH